MRFKRMVVAAGLAVLMTGFLAGAALGKELDGWIKGEMCWVVKEPSKDAKIVGIIKRKAAVTVEDAGKGWLKIVYAPVRDPKTGKFIECGGCFIEKGNFTVESPAYWR